MTGPLQPDLFGVVHAEAQHLRAEARALHILWGKP